jgi:hypothetical protein
VDEPVEIIKDVGWEDPLRLRARVQGVPVPLLRQRWDTNGELGDQVPTVVKTVMGGG